MKFIVQSYGSQEGGLLNTGWHDDMALVIQCDEISTALQKPAAVASAVVPWPCHFYYSRIK